MLRPPLFLSPLVVLALAAPARAALWQPKPGVALTENDGVAQKLELVDLDADGFVDIVVPYSGGEAVGDDQTAQLNRIFLNLEGSKFVELFGVFEEPDNAYAIKAGDIDGDGDADLVVGVNFLGQSYLLFNDGGALTRQDLFPGEPFSIGDLELGDVDGDGDLDILAADWGTSMPYGDPADPGAALRLWLNDGAGGFSDASAMLPAGMDALVSWSFDVELFDNHLDFDLDVAVASRGPGPGLVLTNDGAGLFDIAPQPALLGKDVNFAFTPVDLDGDDDVDLVTLQDGGEDCEVQDGGKVCGARNSALVNGMDGVFDDATATFWPTEHNPPGADLDAAALDLDSDGKPDLLVSGSRLGPVDNATLLLANNGTTLSIDAVDPLGPTPDGGAGLMFADFDHDRREDVAVAVRDAAAPNLVLFGSAGPPDQVPEDSLAPEFDGFEQLPDLLLASQAVQARLRVHDRKTPTRWHDFQHDPALETLNLLENAATAHRRRLPYLEFALGLADPDELAALPDTGPEKTIVPAVWFGESLWSIAFTVPGPVRQRTTLTYNFCAIDAAGNKACVGPFQAQVSTASSCGDLSCGPGENVSNCPEDCQCVTNGLCEPFELQGLCRDCGAPGPVCGDGFCEALEDSESCPDDCQDCDLNGVCDPGELAECCDCTICTTCGDGICQAPELGGVCPIDCPEPCPDGSCGPTACGNCTCEPGENSSNCPQDCSLDGMCVGTSCGDLACEEPENADNCPADCEGIDSATGGGADIVVPGCLCRDAPASGALGLLFLLARRRRVRLS